MLEDVGSKMRQEGDREDQIEPRMDDWRLPDGKNRGGWVVNEPFWALLTTVLYLLQRSKTLRL